MTSPRASNPRDPRHDAPHADDRDGPARDGRARDGRADDDFPGELQPEIEVRRSRRRTRTVSAFREGGKIIVAIPARMTRAQEREWVARMVAQLQRKEARRKPSDQELERRAAELNRRYLGGRAEPHSVQWSTRQRKRWGSCTPTDRSIRLSTRLQGMPEWVVDYVLVHELVHLLHANHDASFWAEVARYPDHERAKAFLDGVSWADQHPAQRGTGPSSGHGDLEDDLADDGFEDGFDDGFEGRARYPEGDGSPDDHGSPDDYGSADDHRPLDDDGSSDDYGSSDDQPSALW